MGMASTLGPSGGHQLHGGLCRNPFRNLIGPPSSANPSYLTVHHFLLSGNRTQAFKSGCLNTQLPRNPEYKAHIRRDIHHEPLGQFKARERNPAQHRTHLAGFSEEVLAAGITAWNQCRKRQGRSGRRRAAAHVLLEAPTGQRNSWEWPCHSTKRPSCEPTSLCQFGYVSLWGAPQKRRLSCWCPLKFD